MSANKPVDLSTHEEEPIRKMWAKVQEFVAPLEELYKTVKDSSPPTTPELDRELNSSDDPKMVEYREEMAKLEKAKLQVREDAHKHLLSGYHSIPEDELKKLREEFSTQYKKAQATIAMLRTYAETLEVAGVVDELKRFEMPTLRGTTRVTGGTSTTTSRARVAEIRVTKPGKATKTFGRFSQAAVHTGLDTTVISSSWLEASGETEWQSVNDVVDFEIDSIKFSVTPESAVQTELSDSEESEDTEGDEE